MKKFEIKNEQDVYKKPHDIDYLEITGCDIQKLNVSFAFLKKVKLNNVRNFRTQQYQQEYPCLESLELNGLEFQDEDLPMHLSDFCELKKLHINNCGMDLFAPENLVLPGRLEELRISLEIIRGVFSVIPKTIRDITLINVENARSILYPSLNKLEYISICNSSLQYLDFSCFEKLKVLILENVRITQERFDTIPDTILSVHLMGDFAKELNIDRLGKKCLRH